MKTKISLLALTLATAITFSKTVKAQDEGETLFNTVCIACHTIGGGDLVGPDLKDVHKTRKQDWLISFIRASQTMVNNGDADAVALFEKYYMVPMPDNDFTDEQVKSVIAYIKSQSGGEEAVAETEPEPAEEKEETTAIDEEQEVAGQDESTATFTSASTVVKPAKEEVTPPLVETAEMSQSSFFNKPLNMIILSVIVILLITILVLSRAIHSLSSELKR